MINMGTDETNQKNRISVGLLISKDDLNNTIFPSEIVEEILDTPYYLMIFISREDVVKISLFPTENPHIKKILIKLKEFSPDLVKGISSILKELGLSKNILHTTGLCYELEKCFYETYLSGDDFSKKITVESVKKKFLSVAKIISVEIEDIPLKT